MKEHDQLLRLSQDDDDAPVALVIVENGKYIDWKDRTPDEVLYIPESRFESVARSFIQNLGRDYYGTVGLSNELFAELERSLTKRRSESEDPDVQFCVDEMLKFLSKGKQMQRTHYLAFEGP